MKTFLSEIVSTKLTIRQKRQTKEESNMIIDNNIVFERLCAEFSARFSALDIKKVSNYDLRQNEENAILFCHIATNQQTNIQLLMENGYHRLIIDLLLNCELTDNLKEASKPFVNEKAFYDIKEAFHQAQKHCSYAWEEDGLYISASEILVDIVLFPVSQFHTQIINSLDRFREFIEIGGSPTMFFLNSQSPSFFTQFSDFWVANILGIPVSVNNNPMMVI